MAEHCLIKPDLNNNFLVNNKEYNIRIGAFIDVKIYDTGYYNLNRIPVNS
tara:strand:- start:76 stop:225 length:150 start_codon:yes stop_codon:yes gene_type:complete